MLASLVRLWRSINAWMMRRPRFDASTADFSTVPSFKSPRSSSLELLDQVRPTRYGRMGHLDSARHKYLHRESVLALRIGTRAEKVVT